MSDGLSILIVNYNSSEALANCLNSLKNILLETLPIQLIVIDNASDDVNREELENIISKNFSNDFILVRNEKNLGFAAAVNIGIQKTVFGFILILNPDVELIPENKSTVGSELRKVIQEFQKKPEIGALGPKLIYPDGKIQPSSYQEPSLLQIFAHLTGIKKMLPMSWIRKKRWLLLEQNFGQFYTHEEPRFTEILTGAALFLRAEAVQQIGSFDEKFFLYYEEIDYCKRLRQAGWKIHFFPALTFVHKVGGSSERFGQNTAFYRYQSLWYFYKKYRKLWELVMVWILVTSVISIQWLFLKFSFIIAWSFKDSQKENLRVKLCSLASVLKSYFSFAKEIFLPYKSKNVF